MSVVSFIHPKWGAIRVTYTARARRITLRGLPDAINITAPVIAKERDIENALEKFGETLLQQRNKKAHATIDTTFKIDSDNIKLIVEEHDRKDFIMRYQESKFILLCPNGTNYPDIQEWLHKVVTNTLKKEAKRVLPTRLKELAEANGFRYNSCSIRDMHTRWGSCNQKGNISLSLYLILLPDRLINYVLLHELCHTVEMNHGEHFWSLLDKVCCCNSRELRKELKKHRTAI